MKNQETREVDWKMYSDREMSRAKIIVYYVVAASIHLHSLGPEAKKEKEIECSRRVTII